MFNKLKYRTINELKTFSEQRLSWMLLVFVCAAFLGAALFFQHVWGMKPCVLCIYERLIFVGILLVALCVSVAIKYKAARIAGLLSWCALSVTGLSISYNHVNLQLHPSPFAMCDMFINFPSWLPLDHIVPGLLLSTVSVLMCHGYMLDGRCHSGLRWFMHLVP